MKLVTIKDVANILGVKQPTLYSWVTNGSVPSYKLNGLIRFDLEEIEEWVKNLKQTHYKVNTGIKKGSNNQDIDNIIKKAIDESKGNIYNPSNGKPGPRQGLRKEVEDGTL